MIRMMQMRMGLLLAQHLVPAAAPLCVIWVQWDGRTLTAQLPPWQLLCLPKVRT